MEEINVRRAICSNAFFLLVAQTAVYFSIIRSYFTSSDNSNKEAKKNMVFWSGCALTEVNHTRFTVRTTLILSARAEAAKIKQMSSSSSCFHLPLNISSSFRKSQHPLSDVNFIFEAEDSRRRFADGGDCSSTQTWWKCKSSCVPRLRRLRRSPDTLDAEVIWGNEQQHQQYTDGHSESD